MDATEILITQNLAKEWGTSLESLTFQLQQAELQQEVDFCGSSVFTHSGIVKDFETGWPSPFNHRTIIVEPGTEAYYLS